MQTLSASAEASSLRTDDGCKETASAKAWRARRASGEIAQVRVPRTSEVGGDAEQSGCWASPPLSCPSLPGASSWGQQGPLKSLAGEQCGPMCSLERCHQLPCGSEEGGQLQGDQVMAVTASRWERVRPELGVAVGMDARG